MPIPALALAALPSVFRGVQGLLQGGKGRKLARNNPRPQYEIPKEFTQNLAIAEQMAQAGLPQASYNQANQNFQRNQAGALRQFGRMGRNASGLAGIVRAGNDSTFGLDVADANARMANQRNAMSYRSQVGQQQLQKQNWDRIGRYNEQADAAADLQRAGRENVYGGLNDLSSLGQYAMMGGVGNGQGGGGFNTNFNPYMRNGFLGRRYIKTPEFNMLPINGLNGGFGSNTMNA